MRPKKRINIEFLNAGGKKAYITKVDLLEETFSGDAGTTFKYLAKFSINFLNMS